MKLDVTQLRYMSREEFRILTAIELGMKNHEFVPTQLIEALAKLTRGGTFKAITQVHKNKLVYHDRKKYDGYKLTYSGYDYLALKALCIRGSVVGVGNQIGVGKEADVFLAADEKDNELVIKLHRLGRISFRQIKNKRDYLLHRKSASWLYLSRLAALKEYAYMKALYDHGFPVPQPMDVSRHCIAMRRIKGYPLTQVSKLANPGKLFNTLMQLITKMAAYGLIHSDFNEFNLLVDDEQNVTMIDFPQMVSTSHYNAEMYFDRDVQCVVTYFKKRYNFHATDWPRFKDLKKEFDLDENLKASGFNSEVREEYEQLYTEYQNAYKEIQGEEIDGLEGESDEEEENAEEEERDDDEEERDDEEEGETEEEEEEEDDQDDQEDEDDQEKKPSKQDKPKPAAASAGVVRIQLQSDVTREPELEVPAAVAPGYIDVCNHSNLCSAAPPAAAATVDAAGKAEAAEQDDEEEDAPENRTRKAIAKKVRSKLQKRSAPPMNRNSNKHREKRKNISIANEYLAP